MSGLEVQVTELRPHAADADGPVVIIADASSPDGVEFYLHSHFWPLFRGEGAPLSAGAQPDSPHASVYRTQSHTFSGVTGFIFAPGAN
jgi:hypothetical protein